jgi:hypothetical protein
MKARSGIAMLTTIDRGGRSRLSAKKKRRTVDASSGAVRRLSNMTPYRKRCGHPTALPDMPTAKQARN